MRQIDLFLNGLSAEMGMRVYCAKVIEVSVVPAQIILVWRSRFEENAAMSVMAISFSGEEKTCMSLGIVLYKLSVEWSRPNLLRRSNRDIRTRR